MFHIETIIDVSESYKSYTIYEFWFYISILNKRKKPVPKFESVENIFSNENDAYYNNSNDNIHHVRRSHENRMPSSLCPRTAPVALLSRTVQVHLLYAWRNDNIRDDVLHVRVGLAMERRIESLGQNYMYFRVSLALDVGVLRKTEHKAAPN